MKKQLRKLLHQGGRATGVHAYAGLVFSAAVFFGALRWRLLLRTPGYSPVDYVGWVDPILASSEDFLVLATVAAFAFALVGSRLGALMGHLIFTLSALGVFFQTKTGLPLTQGLLAQVGGIFEMQSSIMHHSLWRDYLLFFGVVGSQVLASLGLRGILRVHSMRVCLITVFTLLAIFGAGRLFRPESIATLSANTLVSFLVPSPGIDRLIRHPAFHGFVANPLRRELISGGPGTYEKKNVVVLFLESFSYSLVADDKKFNKVMPFLSLNRHEFVEYTRHYSPWSMSSKSLYSVVCADYPFPSWNIEMRAFPERDCASWIKVFREAGYSTWAGYSGNFRYDRMGEFLESQGVQVLKDQNDFRIQKAYAEISWGMDDRALMDEFERWLEKEKPKHFVSLFIPINSHHPFWTPDPAFNRFDDPYYNAFTYQDALIARLFGILEDKKLLDNTIVVITGDHGLRFGRPPGEGLLSESRFHVPLFVRNGSSLNGGKRVHWPTSHVDLGGAILKMASLGKGSFLPNHDLEIGLGVADSSPRKPAYVFDDSGQNSLYMLIDENSSWIFNSKDGRSYRGKRWVTELNDECGRDECRAQRQRLFDILSHSIGRFQSSVR